MRHGWKILDADCHQMEPPDLWVEHIEPRFRDRAPRIGEHGSRQLVFNTDDPHPDGTFPWGIERLAAQPIPEASKRKILWDNAARAFGLAA